MIDMELLSVIRRWHFRDRFSIREIARRTNLSRNTVRRYLRSDSEEPKFSVPDRPSKLDPYADKLSHMLRQEAGKSRKQKRTILQLHADLAALSSESASQATISGIRSVNFVFSRLPLAKIASGRRTSNAPRTFSVNWYGGAIPTHGNTSSVKVIPKFEGLKKCRIGHVSGDRFGVGMATWNKCLLAIAVAAANAITQNR